MWLLDNCTNNLNRLNKNAKPLRKNSQTRDPWWASCIKTRIVSGQLYVQNILSQNLANLSYHLGHKFACHRVKWHHEGSWCTFERELTPYKENFILGAFIYEVGTLVPNAPNVSDVPIIWWCSGGRDPRGAPLALANFFRTWVPYSRWIHSLSRSYPSVWKDSGKTRGRWLVASGGSDLV